MRRLRPLIVELTRIWLVRTMCHGGYVARCGNSSLRMEDNTWDEKMYDGRRRRNRRLTELAPGYA